MMWGVPGASQLGQGSREIISIRRKVEVKDSPGVSAGLKIVVKHRINSLLSQFNSLTRPCRCDCHSVHRGRARREANLAGD